MRCLRTAQNNMKELVTYIARTTRLSYNEAAELVQRGLMLRWAIDEMRPYADILPDVIACAAAGFSKEQIAGWRDKLPALLVAYRYLHVEPRSVPNAPPE